MRRPVGILALAGAVAIVLGACESSQDKSAGLESSGGKAFQEKGLEVQRLNPNVKVVEEQVLQDKNGAAAVVVLRSTVDEPIAGVPVAIEVLGSSKKKLFANDEPGLDPALTGPSVLPPGRAFAWVHDQVVATARAATLDAKIGLEERSLEDVPQIEISDPRLSVDPASGIEATGTVVNKSSVLQRELAIYCVARKAGKIVAAGRGGIPRLKPGERRTYHLFFIGNPRGAQLTIEAPPTVFS